MDEAARRCCSSVPEASAITSLILFCGNIFTYISKGVPRQAKSRFVLAKEKAAASPKLTRGFMTIYFLFTGEDIS